MTTPVVSFQKKAKTNMSSIPGTKPSVQNAQLLISTGIPSFDFILGGGQPVGTVLLIEEDSYREYSNIVFRYFLAEGVVCGHSILLGSLDEDPKSLITELPAPVYSENESIGKLNAAGDSMKIAWRYENKDPINTELKNKSSFGHNFDLSKSIDPSLLEKVDIGFWDGFPREPDDVQGSQYNDLWKNIHNEIIENKFATTSNLEYAKRNVLRIGIQSLASPYWNDFPEEHKNKQINDLNQFLYKLRALMRSAFAVAIITIPAHIQKSLNIPRIRHIVDICVGLESFTGSDRSTNPIFKEYHGLFHIHKIAAINSLAPPATQIQDLAFKLHRKRFCVEKLHLPPELQESAEREQDDIVSMVSCGSSNKHLLEF